MRPECRHFLPLVRASAVIPFIQYLEAAGAPVDRYLADARLSSLTVEDPEQLVPLGQALKFVDRASDGEGIVNLGLLVGVETEIADLATLGRAILRSVTLLRALMTAIEAINLHNSGERIWLLQDDDKVLLCHAYTFPDAVEAAGVRHGSLLTIMMMIKLVRLVAGAQWWPREIRLAKAETVRKAHYEAGLPADLVFHEDPASAIVLDRPLLARALAGSDTCEVVLHDDIAFLRTTAPALDLDGSVSQAIGAMLPSGYPDVRWVSGLAGMNVRSFQRRLAAEGTSYSSLVERARFEQAVRLLLDDRVKLIDIAYELGYTEAANFTRAFRTWAGYSPSKYRRMVQEGLVPPILATNAPA